MVYVNWNCSRAASAYFRYVVHPDVFLAMSCSLFGKSPISLKWFLQDGIWITQSDYHDSERSMSISGSSIWTEMEILRTCAARCLCVMRIRWCTWGAGSAILYITFEACADGVHIIADRTGCVYEFKGIGQTFSPGVAVIQTTNDQHLEGQPSSAPCDQGSRRDAVTDQWLLIFHGISMRKYRFNQQNKA